MLLSIVSHAGSTQVVNVELTDQGMDHMMIRADTERVHAGPVTFQVTNKSQDLVHEMLVIKADKSGKALPYDSQEKRIPEDKVADLGEVSELDPGKSGTLTLDLSPGKYLLICNQPAHFKAGMKATLTVE